MKRYIEEYVDNEEELDILEKLWREIEVKKKAIAYLLECDNSHKVWSNEYDRLNEEQSSYKKLFNDLVDSMENEL